MQSLTKRDRDIAACKKAYNEAKREVNKWQVPPPIIVLFGAWLVWLTYVGRGPAPGVFGAIALAFYALDWARWLDMRRHRRNMARLLYQLQASSDDIPDSEFRYKLDPEYYLD